MTEVFDQFAEDSSVYVLEQHAKSGRWFQMQRRWRKRCSALSLFFNIILYIGIHLGWWRDLDASPLSRILHGARAVAAPPVAPVVLALTDEPDDAGDGDPVAVRPASAAAGMVADPDSVAGSSHQSDKKAASANSLSIVAEIIADWVKRALITGVCV